MAVHVEHLADWVFNLETTAGWYVANGIVAHNCRCRLAIHRDGIAKLISTREPVLTGSTVTVKVVAQGDWVVAAEFGTTYPDGNTAVGARYMGRAAVNVRARRAAR